VGVIPYLASLKRIKKLKKAKKSINTVAPNYATTSSDEDKSLHH